MYVILTPYNKLTGLPGRIFLGNNVMKIMKIIKHAHASIVVYLILVTDTCTHTHTCT